MRKKMSNINSYNGFSVGDIVEYIETPTDVCQISKFVMIDGKIHVKLADTKTGECIGIISIKTLDGWYRIVEPASKTQDNTNAHNKHNEVCKQIAASNSLRKAADILDKRRKEYGDPDVCFGKIAEGWGLILGIVVKPHEVALCMDWLKTVRLLQDPTKADSWQDKAGYSALGEHLVKN
jgi:hypothetical protein